MSARAHIQIGMAVIATSALSGAVASWAVSHRMGHIESVPARDVGSPSTPLATDPRPPPFVAPAISPVAPSPAPPGAMPATSATVATEPVAERGSEREKPEAETHEWQNRQLRFASNFSNEAVDPAWASGAQASIGQALMKLGESAHFRVEGVECHTTLCRGKVRFGSTKEARAAVAPLIHQVYSPNCAVGVHVENDEVTTGQAVATVRFNCEAARIGEFEATD